MAAARAVVVRAPPVDLVPELGILLIVITSSLVVGLPAECWRPRTRRRARSQREQREPCAG
ncbi:hypothetical protein C1701_25825 [Actinoalloteichus sp. AHMU CJ021]|nr:hypothetical protein C1701_25825 [Actinoalloteichus sp. AHMU CJ021]